MPGRPPAAPAGFAELHAPGDWQAVDFVSDLHLHAQDATFSALRDYLLATPADAVFVLGDLFEAWIGDDAAEQAGFARDSAELLQAAAARRPLFFMAGNRDFLVGDALAARCGFTRLADPTVLALGGHRWLLSHGDLLCLEDTPYLRWRAEVHTREWQARFLAQPLAQREALARQMRIDSRSHQRVQTVYADVDADMARQWLQAAGATALIHGHTHRPREHALGDGLRRIVLSDWDLDAQPPRAEVLRLSATGTLERIALC